jgi:hypothetical protein
MVVSVVRTVQLTGQRAELPLRRSLAVDGRVERLAEPRSVLIALERILRQRAKRHGVHGAGHRLVDLGGRQGRFADVLVRHRDRRLTAEGGAAGEQLVEHDAGGIQVGAPVDGFALGLLG